MRFEGVPSEMIRGKQAKGLSVLVKLTGGIEEVYGLRSVSKVNGGLMDKK